MLIFQFLLLFLCHHYLLEIYINSMICIQFWLLVAFKIVLLQLWGYWAMKQNSNMGTISCKNGSNQPTIITPETIHNKIGRILIHWLIKLTFSDSKSKEVLKQCRSISISDQFEVNCNCSFFIFMLVIIKVNTLMFWPCWCKFEVCLLF